MQRNPSRTGMPALVGLLLVVFAIAGLLVYEAWNTGRSRREIAERGLQDYAAYASWSTARAGENILTASLSTIFRGIAWRDSLSECSRLRAPRSMRHMRHNPVIRAQRSRDASAPCST